jgi:putative spermidine/putrescine transport system permease protein
MAVMYMTMVMLLLIIALRFVRPTQMVFRLDKR